MGLLGTTTAEQYYNSSQKFTATASQTVFELTVSNPPSSIDDFLVFVNGVETWEIKVWVWLQNGPKSGAREIVSWL